MFEPMEGKKEYSTKLLSQRDRDSFISTNNLTSKWQTGNETALIMQEASQEVQVFGQ